MLRRDGANRPRKSCGIDVSRSSASSVSLPGSRYADPSAAALPSTSPPTAAASPSPSFAVLFDFGASFFYSTDGAAFNFFEAVEVRAFGLLLRDMVHFLIPIDDQEKEGKKKGEKEEKD